MNRKEPRRGATLIAVLVCLGVAAMLLTTMASRMMLTHRQIQRQVAFDQTYWLCESGVDRALQQMDINADYFGETWQVPSSELGDRGDAEIRITVQPTDDGQRTVTVVARFPLNNQLQMQSIKKTTIPITTETSVNTTNTKTNSFPITQGE